ncbi:MAG: B12-binding domain-containing radical SAM protein [Candidatus Omnitrophica bacterium]|nr:B12-binding domain-containing radical SAM protein [Candidatus Omnitrophota bacterium]
MSKILFISTPYENLGIEYMSAILKSAQHQVELIIDPCLFLNAYQRHSFLYKLFDSRARILQQVKQLKPDLICFSVMTDTYQWGLDLAVCIKREMNVAIVFGGIHPTAVPEVVIQEGAIDYVCVGEGEGAILDLANRCLRPDDCRDIANIWAKSGAQIIRNGPRAVHPDLEALPFPDKELYYAQSGIYSKEYFIMTSRGCRYACAFCCNQIYLKMYGPGFLRRRSVSHVIRELSESRKKHGYKFVWFMDDNFAQDIHWLREFSSEYGRRIGLPFFCYVNPRDMTDEVARLLKAANCHEVAMGVQTLNDSTCRLVTRDTDRISVKAGLEVLRANNIVSATENILGFPGENEQDIVQLIEFYNNSRPDLVMFSWLKIFPATRILMLLRERHQITDQGMEDIVHGKDRSLALGGNFADERMFRSAACLLVLVPFLPKRLVSFLLKGGVHKGFGFLNPMFLLRVLRLYKTTRLAMLITGRRTYDAGAKISLRIQKYFILKKIKGFLKGRHTS